MAYYGNRPVNFFGVSGITTALGPNDPELGSRATVDGKEYIFVYNAGSSTANIGHMGVVSAVSGYSVTVSSVTNVDFAIGVVVNSGLATGEYGWLQTRGFAEIEMSPNNSAAVADVLTLGPDGGFANVSNTTGVGTPTYGKAMEAMASGASGTAYISVF
jgi:hypothetical protein